MKERLKGNEIGNYQTTSYLNILWKMLTDIFAGKIYVCSLREKIYLKQKKICAEKDPRASRTAL